MPDKWSNKDERQYEHIKQSQERRGAPKKRAKAIAGATVNRERRKEGRTPNQTTQGTGNPKRSLADRTKQEVYNQARSLGISGRSKMSKEELVSAVRKNR